MTAMTAAEERLVVTGTRYFAAEGMSAFSAEELAGETAPGSFITDARDAWYTARDLMRPDHEHVWITITTYGVGETTSYCASCGQHR